MGHEESGKKTCPDGTCQICSCRCEGCLTLIGAADPVDIHHSRQGEIL